MIRIYTTPDCGYCRMTKTYLSSRNIQFTEKDIAKDINAADEVMGMVGQLATPVIDIGGEVILGFDRKFIDSALRRKNII